MFKFNKSKSKHTEQPQEKKSWLSHLSNKLHKKKKQFSNSLTQLFRGKTLIDDQLLEELETQLLLSDIGLATTELILQQLKETINKNIFRSAAQTYTAQS